MNDKEFEEQMARAKERGFALPVRPSELKKAWDKTEPVETSPEFDARVKGLIDAKRIRDAAFEVVRWYQLGTRGDALHPLITDLGEAIGYEWDSEAYQNTANSPLPADEVNK